MEWAADGICLGIGGDDGWMEALLGKSIGWKWEAKLVGRDGSAPVGTGDGKK
jgi:hypothetical protein